MYEIIAELKEDELKKEKITLTELAEPDLLPEEYIYKEINGHRLKLEVFKPNDYSQEKKYPAIVCVHGGGWHVGSKEWFRVHARYFAQRGMIAFSIDYRLVNVLPDVEQSKKPVMLVDAVEDCKSAIRFIRSNAIIFGVDVNKIAVLGDSAGSHLAALISGCDFFDNKNEDLTISSKPDLMILCNGVYSFQRDDIWSSKMLNNSLNSAESDAKKSLAFDDTMSNVDVRNYILSPQSFCDGVNGACLLLHGSSDTIVSIKHSYDYFEKLKQSGRDCKFVSIYGASHAFILPWYSAKESVVVNAIKIIDDFLVTKNYLVGESNLIDSDDEQRRDVPPFLYA